MAAITVVHDCDVERRDAPAKDTLNGDWRDTYANEAIPDGTNDGTTIYVGISLDKDPNSKWWGFLFYDLTKFIPADAVVTAARWWFYVRIVQSYASRVYSIERVTSSTWLETTLTWNNMPSTSATPTRIDLGNITATGWYNYDIKTFVDDARSNRSGICTFMMFKSDVNSDLGYVNFVTKPHPVAGDPFPAWVHHLRITYTLAGKTFEVIAR